MKFVQAVSCIADAAGAADQITAEVRDRLDDPVDFAVLMCTHDYRDQYERLVGVVAESLRPGNLIGCTGEGIFGGGREIERAPGVSLLAASLPGVEITTFTLTADDMAATAAARKLERSGIPTGERAETLILLADPFTAPADTLTEAVNAVCPGWAVAGGMASGAMNEGENRLFLGNRVLESGAVGAALAGRIRTRTLVSQGCRPIGKPFVITRADRNLIMSLGGESALDRVREVYAEEPEHVRKLMSYGLMVGRVINEQQECFERGDFLIRNVMGFDEESGAIICGDFFRLGQTIQFHVRDAATADEDLQALLHRVKEEENGRGPRGGLCFSCNGRGTRMFDEPDHETAAIRRALGDFPMVGHFAAGEFGVVGGRTFIHGHTLSLALFLGAEA